MYNITTLSMVHSLSRLSILLKCQIQTSRYDQQKEEEKPKLILCVRVMLNPWMQ